MAVEPKEQAREERGNTVGGVEQQANLAAAKDASSHHSQDEGGPGVVAEGQEPLGLCLGTQTLAVQLQGGFGPQGVAAHKAQHHGDGAAAADPKQGAHDSLQQPPQIGGQPQIHRQGGEHKKWKGGGDDDVAAQG